MSEATPNYMIVNINGTEYPLATTLRVAYELQGQHNHKPYSKIFEGIGDMPVEQQIGIIYAAFKVANYQAAQTLKQMEFTAKYLDNYNLKFLMGQLQALVKSIMGTDENELPEIELPNGEKCHYKVLELEGDRAVLQLIKDEEERDPEFVEGSVGTQGEHVVMGEVMPAPGLSSFERDTKLV